MYTASSGKPIWGGAYSSNHVLGLSLERYINRPSRSSSRSFQQKKNGMNVVNHEEALSRVRDSWIFGGCPGGAGSGGYMGAYPQEVKTNVSFFRLRVCSVLLRVSVLYK